MRICFISHYSGLMGANRSLLALLGYLKVNHPEVELSVILPQEGLMFDALQKLEVECSIFKFGYGHCNSQLNWKGKLIERIYFLKSLWSFFKRRNLFRNADLIYSNSSVISQGFVMALIIGKPHIWHVREFGIHYNLTHLFGRKVQLNWLLKSDAVIFVSVALRKHFLPNVAASQNVHVVYNGVFSKYNSKLPNKKIFGSGLIKFCFIGVLSENKNVIEAIQLIKLLNQDGLTAELVICGPSDGSYSIYVHDFIRDLQLQSSITLLGYVSDVKKVLINSHFLIMPSRFEAMGRVTAEAMSMGVPVIGHNSGGTAELFDHLKSGIHYNQIEEVSATLKTLNSDSYEKISKEARQLAIEKYSIEEYGQNIFEICEEIVARAAN